MAEEKPFEPTHSRLKKAKREGDVARSQDMCAIAAFGAGTITCAVQAAPLAAAFRESLLAAARGQNWAAAAAHLLALVAAALAAGAGGAVAAAVLQGGITTRWPAVKLERLSPAENAKRILSRETAVTLFRSLLTFAGAGAAAAAALVSAAAAAVHLSARESVVSAAWHASIISAFAACACAGVFALGDYGAQLRRRHARLRMSHDELQRDRKENEGDPLARSRRRAMYRQLARGSLRRLKDAAFVVVNPEHIAVAIEYRPPVVAVPRVLVRAADDLADRVRALAAELRIPTFRNVRLARLLYETRAEYIPPECYAAVAQIVAAIGASSASK